MMGAADFDEIVAGVTLDCDYTIDNGGDHECAEPAKWYLIYHGCNAELLCDDHAGQIAGQVMHVIKTYGSVVCTECNKSFDSPLDFIRVRKVG